VNHANGIDDARPIRTIGNRHCLLRLRKGERFRPTIIYQKFLDVLVFLLSFTYTILNPVQVAQTIIQPIGLCTATISKPQILKEKEMGIGNFSGSGKAPWGGTLIDPFG